MTGDEFRRKIAQTVKFLNKDMEILRTVSSPISLPVNKEYNEVALDPTSRYMEIYRSAVSLSQYNVMLYDYAVFQFSWETEESWRLAYLPNPWLSGVESAQEVVKQWEILEDLGGLDHECITQLIDEIPYHGAVPSIRFDYAVHQYKEIAHPAAHLHIGRHDENRWPLARPLDPLTFTMMIIKFYYGKQWNNFSSYYGEIETDCIDKKFSNELKKMPIVHKFSIEEFKSIHLYSR